MSGITFTQNYRDHSNDEGFQFEYLCDKCGNGWRSSFQTNKLGMAAGFLRVAGSLFGGGSLWAAANAGDKARDVLRGPAWDSAFAAAVTEGKARFKQCSRCGKWVCPEVCWNAERGMCDSCAPKLQQEMAAAQAQAAKDQVWEKARQTDQTGAADLTKKARVACPHCGAAASGGKFCGECGKPFEGPKDQCGKCQAKMAPNAKFCPECGAPRG
jgi:hypothetical protein